MAIVFALVACGSNSPSAPTPTPAPPTAAPGQMTVADVIALAEPAWPNVTTMRTTSESTSSTDGGDAEAFTGSVQDWTVNGDRHIIEFQNGNAINEHIYADGVVYLRGTFVSSAIAPGLDVNTWITVDPASLDADSQAGVQVDYLTRTQLNPYGTLTEDVLGRPVQDEGSIIVRYRTCRLYTFGDESQTGDEIRYEIAVGEDGLPCQVTQRAGDFQNSTVYLYNIDFSVDAPLEGTPVAATPEG